MLFQSNSKPLIKFQDVYRDAIQSLLGTNPSGKEIIEAYQHAHEIGTSSIQTGGGTFFDIFAKKGRHEWEEVEKIIKFYHRLEMRQSALIRGDFLFSYEPQPFDVVKEIVRVYGKLGMNVFQNFHGLNDIRALKGVAEACRIAREEDGSDIIAQGTICIENNPNITVDNCLKFAASLIDAGHQGFYLKSANGVLDGDFVYELTSKLLDEFDQEVGIHVHSTYGKAPICYMAAIEAAIERKRPITIDVQHPAMSGSTAHPSMLKMLTLIQNHHNKEVRNNAPKLSIEAIKKDMKSLFKLRFRYREYEAAYDKELLKAMEKAGIAGGASSTLKSIPGLVDNLGRLLGTDDWTKIQIAIYEMQKDILPDLGHPTQVTPYAANTTGQAAISLANKLNGKDVYEILYPGLINYLVGRHGHIPTGVNPKLIARALDAENLDKPEEFIPSQEKLNVLPSMYEKLRSYEIEEPTTKQAISAVMLQNGEQHVKNCYFGKNQPQIRPALPFFAQKPAGKNRHKVNGIPLRDIRDTIKAIGGKEKLQEIAERALHLKQIDDGLYEFPKGQSETREQWRQANLKKISTIIHGIADKLHEKGFHHSQITRMAGDICDHNFAVCLQDVCDAKGTGLYNYMLSSLEKYRLEVENLNSQAEK